ncbi:MAG: DUF3014 domain-containing protein [Gammaproteobacteria bacterium]|jgi:hypothetical protein|nr:DUF3014 domain-containing protein [Gammaproteobacteria bacterium]
MRWIISIILALALVAGLWWFEQRRQAELVPRPDPAAEERPLQPAPRYPLPSPEREPEVSGAIEPAGDDVEAVAEADTPPDAELEEATPLPALTNSDEAALATLSELLGAPFVERWVKPDFVIPRAVAVVHSLDGPAPALRTRPLQALDTDPVAIGSAASDARLWTAANADRYDELVETLEALQARRAAAIYARYHPLFQQAWEELGEAEPWFNDRLIDVVDHLLATPEVGLPFEVLPYEGRLHFADESLQDQSWGHKLLIRMGPAHRASVLSWLEDFRRAVIRQGGDSTDRPSSPP